MELWDIYDSTKTRTGKAVDKNTELQPGEYILVVGCWVVDHSGRIFITKRSPEKRFMPNKWENTGGHAIAGEDGADAILRELFEETGIRATRNDLVLLDERRSEKFFSEDYAVVKDFSLEEVTLQEGETCDCAWVTRDRWEEMMETGEIAPSVSASLSPFKEKLIKIIKDLEK